MIVEFLGIGVFSWLMGSINTMVSSEIELQDIIDNRMEEVESWLKNMEKARTKSLGIVIYNSIKRFTELSFMNDFANIQESDYFA
jgi:translation initiation factor IF-2